jgi:hypothetical protein
VRVRALARVAEAIAAAGEPAEAKAIALSVDIWGLDTGALTDVAVALARAGSHQQAETIARSITNPSLRARALTDIAVALARAGSHQHAETIARSITNPNLRARALAGVAEAMTEAGQSERAEVVARSITTRGLDTGTLTDIAVALARAGSHQQAEAIARSVADQNLKARALTEVAEALANAGHATPATQLAALTCTLGRWTNAARAVMALDETAFEALDQVLGGHLDAVGGREVGELERGGDDRAEVGGALGGGSPRAVGAVVLDRVPRLEKDHVGRVAAVDQHRDAPAAGERAGGGERVVDDLVRGLQ